MKIFINWANLAEIEEVLRGGFAAGSRDRFSQDAPRLNGLWSSNQS